MDLKTIRRLRGRTVKALLCKGHGNNGKDALRETIRLLYGEFGMSHATVSDFTAYDGGRKFCLSKLEETRINWSSENSRFNNLDSIQSLKAAITGEPLDLERKGIDERSMMLSTVFLFNVNEAPNLQAGLEAIESRWAVLSFNKTYKVNADPSKGELEADSRFRYDPNFLKERVCPALLNKMLWELKQIAVNGIDYSCTSKALLEIKKETNHLWAFAQDIGLEDHRSGKVYINDLWSKLREWYINNGTLEIVAADNGKEKKIWHDQPRRGDKNVKAPNQIYQRFAELFPKIKKFKNNDASEGIERKGKFYLSGIAIREAKEKQWRSNGEAIGEAVTFTQSHGEAREAISSRLAEIVKMTQQLSVVEKQQLVSLLSQIDPHTPYPASSAPDTHHSPNKETAISYQNTNEEVASTASLASPLDTERLTASSTASTTLEIGSRVANNNPNNKSYNWHGTIVGFSNGGADVRWQERLGMRGGEILWHRLSDLRLL